MDTIKHYSSFPATGVSLRQMVQFGANPSTGAFDALQLCLCSVMSMRTNMSQPQEPSSVPPNSCRRNCLFG
jgi:pyruvate dehydrogenase kinase 2/3/4